MSTQITIAFVDQVSANILMLSQQKASKLRASCRPEPITGDAMFVERIGPKDAQPRGARHGTTPISDADHTRRKLSMVDYVVPADIIDKPDRLKMLIDPQSPYAQNQAFSLHRQVDDVVIEALGGQVFGGHTGVAINNYAEGECRLVRDNGVVEDAGDFFTDSTAETSLTIAKVMTCKQLLDDAEIDEDRPRFFLANNYNINQFMNLSEVKSSDYNTSKVLAVGRIDSFLGFTFIRSTRLPADTINVDATPCYAFAQNAIVLAVAEEPTVNIDLRPDMLHSTQVYSTLSIGATRVEGPAVVQINLKTKA